MKKHILIFGVLSTVLITTSFAQSWNVTGNSGINTNTNFIGTTDNKPLVFKTNNAERMRILPGGKIGIGTSNPLQKLDVNGNINITKGFKLYMENHPVFTVDSIGGNIFLGNGSGARNAGSYNSATGYQALSSNTSGSYNTANGYQALYSNGAGYENTATGFLSLYLNSTGYRNAAYGNYALFLNSTGYYNVAGGYSALFTNSTGSSNTAYGYSSLYSNLDGRENVGVGKYALYKSSSGMYNTAIGTEALFSNADGYNTATGYRALYANTIGYDNTANGSGALFSNTEGVNNTAVGINAMYSNTSGHYNTAVGNHALFNTLTSQGNTAVGDIAGAAFHNGYYNTFIGSQADATAHDIYNSTALGNTTLVTAPSQVRIGNSFVNSIGGYANWTNISDGRVKKNIKENVPGLNFINKLKPVTYNLDLDAADKIVQRPSVRDREARPDDAVGRGKILTQQPSQLEINARNAKQQIVYTGFIAQDVEKAAKELNYDFSGVDAAKNDKDLYGLRYAEFVVPLVKAVQELSKKNDDKDAKINELQKQIDELKAMIVSEKQQAQTNDQQVSLSSPLVAGASSLQQNVPNPFDHTTTINYTLPQTYSSAKIIVVDGSGKTIKAINVSGTGKGSLNVDASSLSSGTYHYSLIVDGKLLDSKQMILAK